MGATNFYTEANGATLSEAFQTAVDNAHYEYGHRGYTGTIAEKSGAVEFRIPLDCLPELPDVGHSNESFGMRVDGVMCYLSEWDEDYEAEKILTQDEADEWGKQTQADARALRQAMGYKEFHRMRAMWNDKWGYAVAFRIDEAMYGFCGLASC